MSRHNLPQSRSNAGGYSFLPSFQKEMNKFLDQFKSSFPMMDEEANDMFSEPSFPAMDIVETEDAVDISAEVPGVKEEDLDVSISGDALILKGEKSAEYEKKDDSYHRIERRYGSFRRQIPLGFSPENDAVQAEFGDGVLKLHIAKPATSKVEVQKIDIKKT